MTDRLFAEMLMADFCEIIFIIYVILNVRLSQSIKKVRHELIGRLKTILRILQAALLKVFNDINNYNHKNKDNYRNKQRLLRSV